MPLGCIGKRFRDSKFSEVNEVLSFGSVYKHGTQLSEKEIACQFGFNDFKGLNG